MPADTLRADLTAIRALGDALTRHATDLDQLAAALRAMPSPAAALGPVGERFVTAFIEAVGRHSDAVLALGTDTAAGAARAGATAAQYAAAGQRAAELLPRV
ncbi:hypothetical protein FR943_08800 [Mycobacterium sp. TNTM28]|uniref:ESX-1 secretion-associated protein n=1 Tax=[Mycobacterium] fortunisiensis TaxID=2600579 RepID=A0ABS6KKC3_9MYCO|nr:hypothetical protein [[Mycobacterium] fortunisiensis]MBU9763939.1 hypothetical protein [[Mycobacterium] fortunisiensis]